MGKPHGFPSLGTLKVIVTGTGMSRRRILYWKIIIMKENERDAISRSL
jgi:hypothetical protein